MPTLGLGKSQLSTESKWKKNIVAIKSLGKTETGRNAARYRGKEDGEGREPLSTYILR
jgi:hypothetical protein